MVYACLPSSTHIISFIPKHLHGQLHAPCPMPHAPCAMRHMSRVCRRT